MADKAPRKYKFHSEAHRKKMQELVADGKITQHEYDLMEHHTPKHSALPERKKDKK